MSRASGTVQVGVNGWRVWVSERMCSVLLCDDLQIRAPVGARNVYIKEQSGGKSGLGHQSLAGCQDSCLSEANER